MNLGGKSLKVNFRKTLAIALTVALAVATLGALLMLAPAKAQGTITLSSENLNPAKVVKIVITGDLGDGPLRLVVKDKTGATLPLVWYGDDPTTTTRDAFYAYKVGPRTYVAYLGGGLNAKDEDRPASPPEFSKFVHPDAFAYLKTPPERGQYLTIEVVGTDITKAVLYDTVGLTLTFTTKDVAYRRSGFMVQFTIKDGDLNYDPTAKDSVNAGAIAATLKLVKAEGGEVIVPSTVVDHLDDIIGAATITETGANTGEFSLTVAVSQLNNLFTNPQTEGGRAVMNGDRVQLILRAMSGAQGGWDDYSTQAGSDTFNVVYRKPTISISVDSKYVVIDITSPDDNTDPKNVDHLDDQDLVPPGGDGTPDNVVRVSLIYGTTTVSNNFACANIEETDVNTGVFRLKLKVQWGSQAEVGANYIKLPANTDGPFKIRVEYKTVQTRPAGYNVDVAAEALYVPEEASVEVVKATVKSIVLKVKDSDLNNDAKVVEWLDSTFPDSTKANIELRKAGTLVAKLEIYDIYGNLVGVTNPAGLVSFTETDFDTGVFTVKIKADQLAIEQGKTYIVKYRDLTGYTTTTGLVQVNVPIAVIAITLDRTELPVRQGGVNVIITYSNDYYNADPSKKDSAPITVKIVKVDGSEVDVGPLSLTETDIDSGVFKGVLSLGPAYFSNPSIIDAKLKVWNAPYIPEDRAVTATFRAHDASVEVSPVNIKWGDTITVKVRDYDANWRTNENDTVTVTLLLGNLEIKPSVELKETGPNTGEFVGSLCISWDDSDIAFRRVAPGSTISVKYVDNTPIMSPTTATWQEVPYLATFKVVPTGAEVIVKTAVEGYLGVLEELKLDNITVVDPDMNLYVLRADSIPNVIAPNPMTVSIEGVPEVATYTLAETAANSGTFVLPVGQRLSLKDALTRTGILQAGATARELAETLSSYVGKKVAITYVDEFSATGARNVLTKTLTLKAWTATITTSAEAVNLGDWLTITINNPDIAGTTVTAYKQVMVKSTSYPAGLMFYIEEVSPGVFQLKLQVVSVADWVPGAKQIPAKLGDTITIEYVDPVTEDGKANVLLTKTVVVGVPVERPVPASEQKFLDVTGAEKKVGKVGETVMLSAKVQNVDVVDREFTAVFQVKDERGAVVYIAWITAKLAPGTSMTPAVSWTPTVAGTYTVEVLVVKSIAEPTPYSDKISAPFTVQ